MKFEQKLIGTCAEYVTFQLADKHIVSGIRFVNGCNGCLKAISKMCEGKTAESIISYFDGIKCSSAKMSTSCPDQFARILKIAISAFDKEKDRNQIKLFE